MDGAGNAKLLSAGAVASAVAASVCCLGPLVLALLGLGGGVLLLKFEPYRLYFLGTTALFLGAAFYLAYRRPPPGECAPGSACDRPSSRNRQKIVLWIVTVIVALTAAFPYFSAALF
jgi:mercuric ion transport protein